MSEKDSTPVSFQDLPRWKQEQAWRAKLRDVRCARCGGYWSSGWPAPPEPRRPGHSPNCPYYRGTR